jgi:DNA-binding SARP family transcriptional activator
VIEAVPRPPAARRRSTATPPARRSAVRGSEAHLIHEDPAALSDVVRLQLVNGFSLSPAESPLPVPARRLVAFLALADRALARDFVAYTLWPDATEARAQTSLRSAVWQIRERSRGLVAVEGDRLGLGCQVSVDLHDLRRLALRLTDGWEGLDCHALVKAFQAELLPDWYEDWLVGERERWQELRLRALEMLAGRLLVAGHWMLALDSARSAAAIEPLRETTRRILIEAYLREGNLGQALKEYRRFAAQLAEDVGAEPSRSLQALVESWREPAF